MIIAIDAFAVPPGYLYLQDPHFLDQHVILSPNAMMKDFEGAFEKIKLLVQRVS